MILMVNEESFYGMLLGLFIVALGFSIQQTAAQPFAIALGDPATGSGRITFCGGMNSLGSTIGPIVVAFALFGKAAVNDTEIAGLSLEKVTFLYVGVGLLFLVAAALFHFSKKVPAGVMTEKTEPAHKALYLLLTMTALLLICFVPIFKSYNGLNIGGVYINYILDGTEKITDALKLEFELYRLKWTLGALLIVVVSIFLAYFSSKKNETGWGALKYPQLVLGMLAIFVYVGVEVSIQSNLGELLKQPSFGGLTSAEIAPYISMFWGSMMMGRWAGAVGAFEFKKSTNQLLTILLPLLAFVLILGLSSLANYDIKPLLWYIICIVIQIGAFLYCRNRPATTLLVFGLLGMLFMISGVLSSGKFAIYCFLSGGLCCSIMWPCIFALSVAGLGKYTTQGSAFLIMMILGGGIIPPIQGKLADYLQSAQLEKVGFGIHNSYWVPVLCFAYLLVFAIVVRKALKKQGIDFENVAAEKGH